MFEDKTRVAETAGAVALIVVNTEDVLFLMSGKKIETSKINSITNKRSTLPKDILLNSKVNEHENDNDNYDINIPTVMITKQDGINLGQILEEKKKSKK